MREDVVEHGDRLQKAGGGEVFLAWIVVADGGRPKPYAFGDRRERGAAHALLIEEASRRVEDRRPPLFIARGLVCDVRRRGSRLRPPVRRQRHASRRRNGSCFARLRYSPSATGHGGSPKSNHAKRKSLHG